MTQVYAVEKETNLVKYIAASLYLLKDIIHSKGLQESDFYFLGDIDMKYVSRVVYVDGECIYNNVDFWLNRATDIADNYDEHTVIDMIGNPVDKKRFDIERYSNATRIACIDGTIGEAAYNIDVAQEMIALFKEECRLTKFTGITPLEIATKLTQAYTLILTGSFREARTVISQLEYDSFLTEERVNKYLAMLAAADAITYAEDDELVFTTDSTDSESESDPE